MFTAIIPPETLTKSELIAALAHIKDDGLVFLKIPEKALKESLNGSFVSGDLYFAVSEEVQSEPCGVSLVGQLYLPIPQR